LLYTEPEDVQNFTVVIMSDIHVQLFWFADGQAKQYTVFWHRPNQVYTVVGLN